MPLGKKKKKAEPLTEQYISRVGREGEPDVILCFFPCNLLCIAPGSDEHALFDWYQFVIPSV